MCYSESKGKKRGENCVFRKNLKLRDFDFVQDNIEDTECNEARQLHNQISAKMILSAVVCGMEGVKPEDGNEPEY